MGVYSVTVALFIQVCIIMHTPSRPTGSHWTLDILAEWALQVSLSELAYSLEDG